MLRVFTATRSFGTSNTSRTAASNSLRRLRVVASGMSAGAAYSCTCSQVSSPVVVYTSTAQAYSGMSAS